MEYTGQMSRMQRDELPDASMHCTLPRHCVYRKDGLCDEPRTNKGNGDAACHRMGNRAIYAALQPNTEAQGRR